MLLFPPLSPSPPHSCPAEVFHTLHPYGRLVQPCPAWSTTHSLQKEQELKPEINVNRRIIKKAMSPELTPELCNTARVFFLLYCSPPPEALFLFFHSTPLCFWTLLCGVLKSVFLYHFSPSLACSLSLSLREARITPSHSCSGMGECLCVYVLVHVHYCVMSRSSVLPLHWNRDLNCLFHLPESNTQSPHVNTE